MERVGKDSWELVEVRTPDDGPAAILSSESGGDSEMEAETELPSSEEDSKGEDERDSEGESDVSEDDDSEDSDFGRPTKSARRGRETAKVINMALLMFKLYSFPSFNSATDLFSPSPDPQSCRFLQDRLHAIAFCIGICIWAKETSLQAFKAAKCVFVLKLTSGKVCFVLS